jgi:hypothetical protein
MLLAPESLNEQRRTNVAEMRKRHDVRFRLRDMLETLKIEVPEPLRADLASNFGDS